MTSQMPSQSDPSREIVWCRDAGTWSPEADPGRRHLEMELDRPYIIVGSRSREGDDGSTVGAGRVTGRVILTLQEQTRLKGVHLQFHGVSTVAWQEGQSTSMRQHNENKTFFTREWHWLESERGRDIKAGTHVFTFILDMPDHGLPPSIQLAGSLSQIRYYFIVKAKRTQFHTDYHAFREIPVVRGLPANTAEIYNTVDIESTWTDKIVYHISIPRRGYVLGNDHIDISMRFQPLGKLIGVQSIKISLVEFTTLWAKNVRHDRKRVLKSMLDYFVVPGNPFSTAPRDVRPKEAPQDGLAAVVTAPGSSASARRASTTSANASSSSPSSSSKRRASHQDCFYPHMDNYRTVLGYADAPDTFVNMSLEIPESAHASSLAMPIVISHKVRFQIGILNPDGHLSELGANTHIQLFSSLLTNELIGGAATAAFGESTGAFAFGERQDLPMYETHIHDRIPLYDVGHASVGVEPIVRQRERAEGSGWGSSPFQSPGSSRPSSPQFDCSAMPNSTPTSRRSSSSYGATDTHVRWHAGVVERPTTRGLSMTPMAFNNGRRAVDASSRRSSIDDHMEQLNGAAPVHRAEQVSPTHALADEPSPSSPPSQDSPRGGQPRVTTTNFVDEELLSSLVGRPTFHQVQSWAHDRQVSISAPQTRPLSRRNSPVPTDDQDSASSAARNAEGSSRGSVVKSSLSSKSLSDLRSLFGRSHHWGPHGKSGSSRADPEDVLSGEVGGDGGRSGRSSGRSSRAASRNTSPTRAGREISDEQLRPPLISRSTASSSGSSPSLLSPSNEGGGGDPIGAGVSSQDLAREMQLISSVPSYEVATQGWMSTENVRSGRVTGLPSYEDVTTAHEKHYQEQEPEQEEDGTVQGHDDNDNDNDRRPGRDVDNLDPASAESERTRERSTSRRPTFALG